MTPKEKLNVLDERIAKLMNETERLEREATFKSMLACEAISRTLEEKGYCLIGGEYVIEKIFEYRGYKCVIALMSLGHRCGYVAIPNGHEYFGVDCDEIPIGCHGGLTYSGDDYPIPDGNWYIGFDCGHCMDSPDYAALAKYFKGNAKVMESISWRMELDKQFGTHGEIRSQDYVRNELMDIVNQLLGDDEPKWYEDDEDEEDYECDDCWDEDLDGQRIWDNERKVFYRVCDDRFDNDEDDDGKE